MDNTTTYNIIYLNNINIKYPLEHELEGATVCHLIINHEPMNFSSWPIFACRIGVLSVYQFTGEIRGESSKVIDSASSHTPKAHKKQTNTRQKF